MGEAASPGAKPAANAIQADPPRALRAGLQVATSLTRALGPRRYVVADTLGLAA